MKELKVMATINEQGQLILERPLMSDRNSRVQVIILIPEGSEEASEMGKESKETLRQDFRQAWHEAMTGQTIPVAQLWEGLENGRIRTTGKNQ